MAGVVRHRSATRQQEQCELMAVARKNPSKTAKQSSRKTWLTVLSLVFIIAISLFALYQLRANWFFLERTRIETSSQELSVDTRTGLDIVLNPIASNSEPSTITHNWKITSSFLRPDGVLKNIYLINDQFPGPTVRAKSGDSVVIKVENALEDEGISIHWHGLYMRDANEMDGAVGYTQDPIPPGETFTYQFKVADDQHGTFWYHAHDGVQRAEGLFGALIVDKRDGSNSEREEYGYDEDRVLMVGDWYHRPATEVLAWYLRAGSFGNEPVPDSILVNGLGAYNCSMAVPARPVDCVQVRDEHGPIITMDRSKKYRFRIINVGTLAGVTVGFDNAALKVIQVDGGTRVTSEAAKSIEIVYPGQRTDFILEWQSDMKQSLMKIQLDDEGFRYTNPALADTHYYAVHLAGNRSPNDITFENPLDTFNIAEAISADPVSDLYPSNINSTLLLYTNTQKLSHLKNIPHGFMNQTSWKPQSPPLMSLPRNSWNQHQFVPYVSASSSSWTTIILNNLDDSSHPFHLHGYSPYIIQIHQASHGWGSYSPYEMNEPPGGGFILERAVKRDTVWVPRRGYVVLRFRADNVGIWMFHCHILWHLASGMAMGIDVGNGE
jgi:FtsP/CotA-like multicopper oxidase with cupredoxin domain